MAVVRSWERFDERSGAPHSEVDATYGIVQVDGVPHLQIDTYGSDERKLVGKKSQTIRLPREFARELAEMIRTEFSADSRGGP